MSLKKLLFTITFISIATTISIAGYLFFAKQQQVLAAGNIINAASCSQTDVQAAINQAVDGDTVMVPVGSCVWDATLTIPNTKGIILQGADTTIIRGVITSPLITISTSPASLTRITGFNFTQTTKDKILTIGGGFANPKFRIDHCSFYTSASGAILLVVHRSWGLIDHCSFTASRNSEMIHNEAWGAGTADGWSEDIIPGSGDALYIEDSIFTNGAQDQPYFWGNSGI